MVVFDIKCVECDDACNSIHFQHNFINWTSGNNAIDKFIRCTQLSAHKEVSNVLEWIPYDRFYNITENKFNEMYAKWIDGCIIISTSNTGYSQYQDVWDYNNQDWKREKPNISVILKILNNSANVVSEFINEV
jgi:hypothetical protein